MQPCLANTIDENESTFSIFPNPANDYLQIDFPGADNLSVQIYSIDSRVKMKKEISDFKIDIKELTAGLYLLRVSSFGRVVVSKFIKE